mmetsp:Transcript_24472/g.62245  ORF Transcript_24472/g.62245 Transcript_24472/m.62245 type:complete len:491 (+) Transcript_24472:503-1975(+)
MSPDTFKAIAGMSRVISNYKMSINDHVGLLHQEGLVFEKYTVSVMTTLLNVACMAKLAFETASGGIPTGVDNSAPSYSDERVLRLSARYARFSAAAYEDRDQHKMHLLSGGQHKAVHIIDDKHLGTYHARDVAFFVAYDPTTNALVVTVRGTRNLCDAITDLDAHPEFVEKLGAHVHRGALATVDRLLVLLRPIMVREMNMPERRPSSLVLTGHSLGGSVAVVLALLLLVGDEPTPGLDGTLDIFAYAYGPNPVVVRAAPADPMPPLWRERVFVFLNGFDPVPRICGPAITSLCSAASRLHAFPIRTKLNYLAGRGKLNLTLVQLHASQSQEEVLKEASHKLKNSQMNRNYEFNPKLCFAHVGTVLHFFDDAQADARRVVEVAPQGLDRIDLCEHLIAYHDIYKWDPHYTRVRLGMTRKGTGTERVVDPISAMVPSYCDCFAALNLNPEANALKRSTAMPTADFKEAIEAKERRRCESSPGVTSASHVTI